MSVSVLVASRNPKKLAELRRILAPLVEVDVVGLDDVEPYEEVPESGATFADNALIKGREGYRHSSLLTVADDSGLCVDALNQMPGVLSARWAGAARSDDANVDLVLEQLADVPDDRLDASFVCAVAVVGSTGEQVVEGRMTGHLIRQRRGSGGFGYDPIFVADGTDRTSAELSVAEKDAISHRGRALRAAAPLIVAALGRPAMTEAGGRSAMTEARGGRQ
ncbi:MAG: non-canonical purine NTP pyrophosphatase [bacterium]